MEVGFGSTMPMIDMCIYKITHMHLPVSISLWHLKLAQHC